jgi:hypothetical protein
MATELVREVFNSVLIILFITASCNFLEAALERARRGQPALDRVPSSAPRRVLRAAEVLRESASVAGRTDVAAGGG